MKIRNLVLLAVLLGFLVLSCKKDTYDMDKLSKTMDLDVNLVGPVLKGYLKLSDLIEEEEGKSEYLVLDGDTVKFHIIRDSLFSYDASDLSVIPPQIDAVYNIESDVDIPGILLALLPNDFNIDELNIDTTYTLILENSMRLDSLVLNTGQLVINAQNTFHYSADVTITSASFLDPQNQPLNYTMQINDNGNSNGSIDLAGYKVIFGHNAGFTTLKFNLSPRFHKEGKSDAILASQYINLNLTVNDLNDFEALYGFIGYNGASYDTTVSFAIDGMDEVLTKLKGTFQATNPKIKLNYRQSFGVPLGADVDFDIYRSSIIDASIDLAPKVIPQVEYFTDPPLSGNLVFGSQEGISELVSFPLADSLYITGNIMTNMGFDSLTTFNFVKSTSAVVVGLDVEVPMEFRADLTYTDTLEFNPNSDFEDIDFEYLNLHYWFKNGFPLGFNATLFLYNSTDKEILDSIALNIVSNEPFLKPAEVDPLTGIVITSKVEELHGYTSLDKETTDILLNQTTHFIVRAVLQTYQSKSVQILQNCKMDFQFGIEAKGTYRGTF
jgi:hypothetical protein